MDFRDAVARLPGVLRACATPDRPYVPSSLPTEEEIATDFRAISLKQGADPDVMESIRQSELPATRPPGCLPLPIRLNNPFMVFHRADCEDGHATCAGHGGFDCGGTHTCSDGTRPRDVCL